LVNKNRFWIWRRKRQSFRHQAKSPNFGLGKLGTKQIVRERGGTKRKRVQFAFGLAFSGFDYEQEEKTTCQIEGVKKKGGMLDSWSFYNCISW